MKILEYINWWLPILVLSAPIVWTIIYYAWYIDYKEKREELAWERIAQFFNENADKYPEAATSFGVARFLASDEGREVMYQVKKAEYEQRSNLERKA
jgi:hypothetical protein